MPSTDRAPGVVALTDVVNRLRRALRASIRTDFSWESLPLSQVELLQAVVEQPAAVRVGELARGLNLATNTVSTLVQVMARSGLVVREHDVQDSRAVNVAVTGRGRTLLADWQQAHEKRLEAALDRLTARDRQRVLAAVPALGALVRELTTPEPGRPHNSPRAVAAG